MLIAHALLACLILVSAMAFSAEEVIVYGDESYPPYSYVEAGEFKGIYVDYIRQLTANMSDYRVRISPIPWKRGLSMLKNGSAFALFPPYRFKERDYIQFYSLPLYQESVVVVCNRTIMTNSRVKFPEDFTDVVIGINRGYLLSSELQSAITNNFVKVEEANGNETNLKKLAALHTACYINDKVSIFSTLKKMKQVIPVDSQIGRLVAVEVVELEFKDAFIGFSAASPAKYKYDFIEKLNVSIVEAEKNGVLRKIIDSYLK